MNMGMFGGYKTREQQLQAQMKQAEGKTKRVKAEKRAEEKEKTKKTTKCPVWYSDSVCKEKGLTR